MNHTLTVFFPDIFRIKVETASPTVLAQIDSKLTQIMTDLTELKANVDNNETVIQSAITLLGNIKAALDNAGTDPAALKALSDQLGTNDQALADAVAANTPAAPPAA